jgi:F0F1-type ATP synthase membrane subunit c/vacuolar-type H+-ATPase subunit K
MTENRQEVGTLQAQIVAMAVIASTVIYAAVVLLMKTTGTMPEEGFVGLEPEILNMLSLALLAVGAASAVGSFFVRGALVARLTEASDSIPERLRIVLITMAISESASIYGLVLALLGGLSVYVLLLWGIGLSGKILLFPMRDWLEPTRME